VTEADIRLSADTDCNEERAVNNWTKNFDDACFRVVRRF